MHPYFKNKDPFYSSNLTQHAPDFSYNMMKENIGKCVVEECTKEFDICRKVVNAIDNIYVGNKCIIEGWGFYNEKPYNGNIQLLLKSDNKSYLITTRKILEAIWLFILSENQVQNYQDLYVSSTKLMQVSIKYMCAVMEKQRRQNDIL